MALAIKGYAVLFEGAAEVRISLTNVKLPSKIKAAVLGRIQGAPKPTPLADTALLLAVGGWRYVPPGRMTLHVPITLPVNGAATLNIDAFDAAGTEIAPSQAAPSAPPLILANPPTELYLVAIVLI